MSYEKGDKVELEEMNDYDLLEEYDSARGSMSYYNAAESSWSSETDDRNKASANLDLVWKEVKRRGLTPNAGQYLC